MVLQTLRDISDPTTAFDFDIHPGLGPVPMGNFMPNPFVGQRITRIFDELLLSGAGWGGTSQVSCLDVPGAYLIDSGKPGPRVVIVGGVHGKEACGAWAIKVLLDRFAFQGARLSQGNLTLVVGNEEALCRDQREISRNLNRVMSDEDLGDDCYELRRANEIKVLLRKADLVLDLHSTSQPSDPFVIVNAASPQDGRIVSVPHALIIDFEGPHGISGSVQGYAIEHRNFGGRAITIECGQHYEFSSFKRALRSAEEIIGRSGLLEQESSMPASSEPQTLVRTFQKEMVRDHPEFTYTRRFRGFESLQKGEPIGYSANGVLYAPQDCLIVMPFIPELGTSIERLKNEELLYFGAAL